MKAKETAVVLIEFQNEFCKESGKLNDVVKEEIARQGTIENGVKLAKGAREKGCLVIHCPFVFDEKWADEKCVCGILAGAKEGGAFRPGDWGTEFIDEMKPEEGDIVLDGKRALSGFTNTGLDEVLQKHGIKNIACAGFLSNVCVEATARSGYDRGYQVCVVKDATGAGSKENLIDLPLKALAISRFTAVSYIRISGNTEESDDGVRCTRCPGGFGNDDFYTVDSIIRRCLNHIIEQSDLFRTDFPGNQI